MSMTIGIIGAGTMGRGIAQIAATNGSPTLLFDINEDALEKSRQKIDAILNRLIEKGRMTAEAVAQTQSRLTYTTSMPDLAKCDLVIEAIIEDMGIKRQLYQNIESIVREDCIIATNTSSLSVTALAAALKNPTRSIGIHFFNPAPLMKLVEIIPAIQTDTAVLRRVEQLLQEWKKVTVIAKDTPGFIVNKVARPFYGEALRIYEESWQGLEGSSALATIDWAMTALGGFRMGPFTLMDFIGNDVNYAVTASVFKAFYYDPRYKPAFTQKQLAEAGYLGRKAGRGYYQYGEGHSMPEAVEDKAIGQNILDRILIMLINEAADTLHQGIATRDDIDTAMTKGVNYPKGLLAWADEIGIAQCVERMDALYNEYHEDRYRCSPLLRKMARQQSTFYSK